MMMHNAMRVRHSEDVQPIDKAQIIARLPNGKIPGEVLIDFKRGKANCLVALTPSEAIELHKHLTVAIAGFKATGCAA